MSGSGQIACVHYDPEYVFDQWDGGAVDRLKTWQPWRQVKANVNGHVHIVKLFGFVSGYNQLCREIIEESEAVEFMYYSDALSWLRRFRWQFDRDEYGVLVVFDKLNELQVACRQDYGKGRGGYFLKSDVESLVSQDDACSICGRRLDADWVEYHEAGIYCQYLLCDVSEQSKCRDAAIRLVWKEHRRQQKELESCRKGRALLKEVRNLLMARGA